MTKINNCEVSMKEKGVDDKASKKDLFKIESYTDGLAKFIKECKTPMTIAIQGDWGSGKTSMMNRLEKAIQDSAFCKTINTWQYSQFDLGNQLSISFLSSILSALGDKDSEGTKKLSSILGKFAKHFIKNAADQTINMYVPYGEAVTKAVSSTQEEINNHKEQESLELVEAIDAIRKGIETAIKDKIEFENKKEENKKVENKIDRVVFFIDDLDRLKPGKAVELMEVMKALLECDNCIFVLAIDYSVVVSGIKEKYGNNLAESKAKKFFDKIIQVPFYLPVGNYDIANYIRSLIKDEDGNLLYDVEDDDIEMIVKLIKTSVEGNPRAIKRVINSYILAREILLNEIKRTNQDNVNGEESIKKIHMVLMGTLCLHLAYEEIYDSLLTKCETDNVDMLNKFFDDISESDKDKGNLSHFMENLKQCIKGNKFYQDNVDSEAEKITEEEMKLLRKALISSSTMSSKSKKTQGSKDELGLKKLSYVYEVLKRLDKEKVKSGDNNTISKLIAAAKKEVADENDVMVSTVSDKTTRRLGIESSEKFAEFTKEFFDGGHILLDKIKENNKGENMEDIEKIFNSLRQ